MSRPLTEAEQIGALNRLLRRRAIELAKAWKRLMGGGARPGDREHVLADLRNYCFAGHQQTVFHADALVMARRTGRREAFERIRDFLNLDENQVLKLAEMEVDDGL